MSQLVVKISLLRTVKETDDHIIVYGHNGVFEDEDEVYPKHTFSLEKKEDAYYIYYKNV